MVELTKNEWDEFVSRCSHAHLLQTSAWGELKSAFGWHVIRLVEHDFGAQVLFRKLPMGYSLAYIPKGFVTIHEGASFEKGWQVLGFEIDRICQRKKAILLKIEPDAWEVSPPSHSTAPLGFRISPHAIQPRRTLVVDLEGEDSQLLGRMKQKTRYNIRLAQKKSVMVHPSADLAAFYHLIEMTGGRDGFGVHSAAYYQLAYQLFHPRGNCELFLANFESKILAGLMVFVQGRRAWYLYGASSNDFRELMPSYLLQWEAMRWARALGCQEYDLWGVPDEDEASLEALFTQRSDGLWGVYRFKRGFGGQLRRSTDSLDRVYRPGLYKFYQLWVSRLSGG